MASAPLKRMTVDEFLVWAEGQRERRFELVHSQPIAMSPERAEHVDVKGDIYVALRNAIRLGGLPCHAFGDGMTVRIDDTTAYVPDAVVHCGPRVDRKSTTVANPIIVVEVLSPSTSNVDAAAKLAGYFRLPSVEHYLIVDPEIRQVIHHGRQNDTTIITRIVSTGGIDLTPPGIQLAVEDFFLSL